MKERVERKVQKDGSIQCKVFAGEEVNVYVGHKILDGYTVRPSGYIGAGKKHAGRTAEIVLKEADS